MVENQTAHELSMLKQFSYDFGHDLTALVEHFKLPFHVRFDILICTCHLNYTTLPANVGKLLSGKYRKAEDILIASLLRAQQNIQYMVVIENIYILF